LEPDDNQFGLIANELQRWGFLDLLDRFLDAHKHNRQDEYERLRAEGLALVRHERERSQHWIKKWERERRGSA
jgi:hypothetical protein